MSFHRSGGELHRDVLRQLRWRGDQPLDMRGNIRAKRWQLSSRACQAGLQVVRRFAGHSSDLRSGGRSRRRNDPSRAVIVRLRIERADQIRRGGIPRGERAYAIQSAQRRRNRRVIERRAIRRSNDGALLHIRRDDHSGNAHAVAVERCIGRRAIWRRRRGRHNMIITPAMLVKRDYQQCLLPPWPRSDCVVNLRDQLPP